MTLFEEKGRQLDGLVKLARIKMLIEDKDKIWTFIHNESRQFMEFAYLPLNLSVKVMQKAIDKPKKGQEDNGKRDDT